MQNDGEYLKQPFPPKSIFEIEMMRVDIYDMDDTGCFMWSTFMVFCQSRRRREEARPPRLLFKLLPCCEAGRKNKNKAAEWGGEGERTIRRIHAPGAHVQASPDLR